MKICCTAELFLLGSRKNFAALRTEVCCTADFQEQYGMVIRGLKYESPAHAMYMNRGSVQGESPPKEKYSLLNLRFQLIGRIFGEAVNFVRYAGKDGLDLLGADFVLRSEKVGVHVAENRLAELACNDALGEVAVDVHAGHEQFPVEHVGLEEHADFAVDKPRINVLNGRLETFGEVLWTAAVSQTSRRCSTC